MKSSVRNSKAHVFIDDLGDEVFISGEDHHHLTRVLRLKVGDEISAACERHVRLYEISSIDKSTISANALSRSFIQQENDIQIAVAEFKSDRLEWGIAKAVEAGATKIYIGTSSRSPSKSKIKGSHKFSNRIENIIRNSAMQARRSSLTEIEYVDDLLKFASNSQSKVAVCDPSGNSNVDVRGHIILIGPEGGFTDQEFKVLEEKATFLSLGPTILRAETAMVVATAIAQSQY